MMIKTRRGCVTFGEVAWIQENQQKVWTHWRTDWQDSSMIRLCSDKNAMISFNVNNYHFHVDLCPTSFFTALPTENCWYGWIWVAKVLTVAAFEIAIYLSSTFLRWFLERLCLFSTKRPILSSLAAREDPQKESSI